MNLEKCFKIHTNMKRVVSKTRNGVTGNDVTGIFSCVIFLIIIKMIENKDQIYTKYTDFLLTTAREKEQNFT